MNLSLNTQIEVTQDQFKRCLNVLSGYIAHRQEAGKYYIKILIPGQTKNLKKVLEA